MGCTSPLKGFQIGVNPATMKPKYKITSYLADHVELLSNGSVFVSFDSKIKNSNIDELISEFVEIPCGHCTSCRLNYSKQWADRCMLELTHHDPAECWFVTLTFSPEYLNGGRDPITGRWIDGCTQVFYEPDCIDQLSMSSLSKRPLQLFFKQLRINLARSPDLSDVKVRYYACGEYGGQTMRPHYHAIIYGLPLNDLIPWCKSQTGNMLFRSEFIEEAWKHRGICTVAHISWEACAYTARYCMKKVDGADYFYDDLALDREWTVMSRRPGIGREYFDENWKDIFKYGSINLSTPDGGKKIYPPRYYESLFEAADPAAYDDYKRIKKEKGEISRNLKLEKTDLDYLGLLKVENDALVSRLKSLKRNNIIDGN